MEMNLTDTSEAINSLPRDAVKDLLSVGVCGRCVLRLFGIHDYDSSCPLSAASVLYSYVGEETKSNDCSTSNGDNLKLAYRDSENKPVFCSICLGILQLAYLPKQENSTSFHERISIHDFAKTIEEIVRQEGHQIDSFAIEVITPRVVSENEHEIWLYMKSKYESEEWFKEKFLTRHISVKDALKLSLLYPLENLLDVKCAASPFLVRLTYSHANTTPSTQCHSSKENGYKRRKVEAVANHLGSEVVTTSKSTPTSDISSSEAFHNQSSLSLPQKVYQPCYLTSVCYRTPFCIGGRYLKYSRHVSQTRWIIDDERMGETSVEEIIGHAVREICKCDNYKFYGAGREDIDVRMLGSGRPFLVEIQNARHFPSLADIADIENKINRTEKKLIEVKNLKIVGNEAWSKMREGEAEKQKQYAALVWISRPLHNDDILSISSLNDMIILQKTPIRVLHRRSPLGRNRAIHWMKIDKINGSNQYFLLHLCTQAGTYIKEFVHGDLGRTHPSLGSILGCRAEILQLDVTDVKMECFD